MRRAPLVACLAAATLAVPFALPAHADTGTFADPVDSDTGATDVTSHAVSYDGSAVSSTLTFAEWDLAILQSARLVVELDVDGDGAGDFELTKDAAGQSAEVSRSDSADAVCQATSVFDEASRSVTLSAPASCIGTPERVRSKVYVSADVGFDFAPGPDRYTAAVAASSSTPAPTPVTKSITCPSGGRTFAHGSQDPATADVVSYRLAYDGATACVVFALRGWDRASVQAGRVVALLDTNGDGAADFELEKPVEGERAQVQVAGAASARCAGEASLNDDARTISLSAPASCLDSPASVRGSLYLSFDEGFDFAPAPDVFTTAVSPSDSPAPGSAPAPDAPQDLAPTLTLSPGTLSAGQATVVTYRGTPGSTLDILSRTQPATAFSKIGTVTLDGNGVGTSTHKPQKNTRITARSTGGTMSTTAPIIAVRSVASFNAARVGTRTYTFTGRVYPALDNRLVNLYRNGVLVGQGRSDATGIYRITRTLGAGTFTFQVRTPDDQHNLGTTSRQLRVAIS